MAYSRTKKIKQTKHAINRAKDRLGMCQESSIAIMMRNALGRGQCANDFPPGEFKNYLLCRERGKRIKVYKGKVFVFNRSSKRCITVYPVPEEHMEEYLKYQKLLNK